MHLGKDLDKVMSKFDKDYLKFRRCFSLEHIKEEDSWIASGSDTSSDNEEDEYHRKRRYSFPMTPRSLAAVPDPQFKKTIKEIQDAN